MKNRTEYFLFIVFSRFFRVLGLGLSRKLAGPIAAIFFYLIPIRKKTVISNLRIAFPEYSEQEIKRIAFRNYKNFAIVLIEILSIPGFSREDINKLSYCDDPELVLNKFNEGKGLILMTGHFGNWEIGAASFSSQFNLKINIIVKPLRNPYVDKWMNNARTRWGNQVIPMGASIRKSYQTLKNKEALALAGDQRGPEEGIKLKFFGNDTSVYTGPAIFSLRTGVPIMYLLTIRQKDYRYKIIVEEISDDNLPEDENEKIVELSKRHMVFLEKYIRQYPDHWLWMHKRWKH
jgi:Kdo2-lipid IVA lauroyltransferase/acyltransferase